MEKQIMEFYVPEDKGNERIDKFLSENLTDLSRSYIQKLVKEGYVKAQEENVKPNYRLTPSEKLEIILPELKEPDILPENIPLDIIYEDSDIIVINKGKNMVVHPSAGHYSGTIVNALLYHCKGDLSGINGVMRPGIVHRIDKNTTGVLVVCKNDKAHACIAMQLKDHSSTREYQAIAYHHFSKMDGVVDAPIGRHSTDRKKMAVNERKGKRAVTNYHVISNLKQNFSYISCRLETGRTHQIRVHMAKILHPLLGDEVYGPKRCNFNLEGQVLHAKTLGFIHPSTGKYVEFNSELPPYFTKLLQRLNL